MIWGVVQCAVLYVIRGGKLLDITDVSTVRRSESEEFDAYCSFCCKCLLNSFLFSSG